MRKSRNFLPLALVCVVIVVLAVVCLPGMISGKPDPGTSEPSTIPSTTQTTTVPTEPAPTWATVSADRELTAGQYFVYDCSAGRFITLSGKPSDKVYPASVTKLFTAYVALKYLSGDTLITVGNELDMVGYGSSVAELKKGDVVTVDQLIEGMMLPSGNDASYILAVAAGRTIAQDSTLSPTNAVKAFMKEMNRSAKANGMKNTNFTNPDGYHADDHYTTVEDLVYLAAMALHTPSILRYTTVAADTVVMADGRELQWHNTNAIIDPESPYYCPIALGLKTGQTPRAGSCLLSAFDLDGRILVIGVFNCPEEEDRFGDTLQLLQQAMQAQ
jgi:D-alanyl-D-alanine carboxypeptidase (penicillin-binding protein 5/6)